ncbi:MAG: arginine--tRNA ligase [Patescibacteria group bacterium]
MKEVLASEIKQIVQELFGSKAKIVLTRPESKFGDFSTNVAMQLGRAPAENAAKIIEKLKRLDEVAEATIAGPGFINITLTDATLQSVISEVLDKKEAYGSNKIYDGKTIVAEYSDPNPFKVLHAGHLYTTLTGDVIANLLETAGANVKLVNFGGDVGLHVGTTMWAIIQELGGEHPEKLADIKTENRMQWVSEQYVKGTKAFEGNEAAKDEIRDINKRVYALHDTNDHESPFAQIYWTCRQWSYDGFNELYRSLRVAPFDKYYPESETTELGVETVQEGLKRGVFENSDGAVVLKGESAGLHTRVFITSEGLPTYETKDLGLALTKWQDYRFDLSIMITGNDIVEYMKVVQLALKSFQPEICERSKHITHGMLKLAGGIKMSSRKGNALLASDVLESAEKASKAHSNNDQQGTVLAAVKYAFLKQRIGGDIIYDPEESVSIAGNSGPYLQYAHARAMSILLKKPTPQVDYKLDVSERQLVRKISELPEVVEAAVNELMPHLVCTYLYELAQEFNSFYEANRVIGEPREDMRLTLINAYVTVLKNGLKLLGISAPDHM